MRTLSRLVLSLFGWLGRQSGQTLAEYGILIAVIAVVVIAAAVLFGTSLSDVFSSSARRV